MKISRKIQNYGLAIIGGLSLIGLIIGTFLDQQITAKLGNTDNMFGIMFTALGPVLSLAVGNIAASILFFMPKHEKKWVNIVCRILGAIAFVGFTFFSIKEGFAYVDFQRMQANASTYKALIAVLVALIAIATIIFCNLYTKKLDETVLIRTVIVIFVIIAAWFFVSEVLKYLASRPRPRVIESNPEIAYRPWYAFHPLQAFKEPYKDCKSFTSGHAFNAACLITIIPLLLSLRKGENNSKLQITGIVLGGVWAFVIAFSRIVAKAHFMSDVMGGILLSSGAQALIINLEPKTLKSTNKRAD